MTIRKLIIQTTILSLFLINFNVLSDEIQFLSSNIKLKNNGALLQAFNSETKIPSKKIKIKSDKVEYLKPDKILILNDNVILRDNQKDLIITSENIKFEYKKDLIYSKGYTEIEINNYYKIKSKDIFYNRKLNKIYGNKKTIIEDGQKNIYELIDKFSFDINQ